jgi:hypothetical protein
MNYNEWKREHRLDSAEDIRIFLRNNLLNNRAPVAIYVCPECGEMLDDAGRICSMCGYGGQKLEAKG